MNSSSTFGNPEKISEQIQELLETDERKEKPRAAVSNPDFPHPGESLSDYVTRILGPPKNHYWNSGSATSLTGRIYIASCFVSDPNDDWCEFEKQKSVDSLRKALDWIKAEAIKYGENPMFECDYYGVGYDIKVDRFARLSDAFTITLDFVQVVLSAIGYADKNTFYSKIKEEKKCDSVCVLIFAKGQGRCYALPHSKNCNESCFVEGAVLYNQGRGGSLNEAVIAHEILHLFGAWDFYLSPQQTVENAQKAEELFPNSIMYCTSDLIRYLIADEVTAWLVGWNKNPQPWYESLCPPPYARQ